MTPSTQTGLPWSTYQRSPAQPLGFALQAWRGCPITGSTREETILEIPDIQFYDDHEGSNRALHRVVRNLDSGLLYANPCFTPEGFAHLFEKAGSSYANPDKPLRNQQRVNWIEAWCPEARRILDVGCGAGEFLQTVPADWHRMGLDIDPPSIEAAQHKNPDITFWCEDMERFSLDAPVDVITMFQALEHFPNPLAILKRFREVASPHTRLLVEVPVIDFLAGSPLEQNVVGFLTVMHLTHFSRATLKAMLRHAGWEIEHEQPWPEYISMDILAKPGKVDTTPISEAELQQDKLILENYLKTWRASLAEINRRLEAIPAEKPVLLWGGGMHTEHLCHLTGLFQSQRRFLIVDKDPLKRGTTFHGIPVLAPDDISEGVWKNPDCQIIPSTYTAQKQVLEELHRRNVPPAAITPLYSIPTIST